MKALWALIAFFCTGLGLSRIIEGLLLLIAPHRLISLGTQKGKTKEQLITDCLSKVTGRIPPIVIASKLATGVWILGIAIWLVLWGVL